MGTYHPNKQQVKEKTFDDDARVNQLKELFVQETIKWSNRWKRPFTIDEENKEVANILLLYFAQSHKFEELEWGENKVLRNRPSLNKSVTLFGNVGSGKTLLYQLFNNCFESYDQSRIIPCDIITEKIRKEGIIGLTSYTASTREGGHPNEIMFDDLGIDSKGKFYGDEINPMFDIIMKRYRLYINQGLKSHFTSNATPSQLIDLYDTRTESRLSEMSNYIILGGSATSRDRRKSTLF